MADNAAAATVNPGDILDTLQPTEADKYLPPLLKEAIEARKALISPKNDA